MAELARIRDFKAPKDEASAEELRRQLGEFENNVAKMGDALKQPAMQRLVKRGGVARDNRVVLSPGQFQLFDTGSGEISATLAKPTAAGAGTFLVAIDVAAGANNLFLRAAAGCTVNLTDHVTVLAYAALLFCDGENYWRVT